MSEINQTRPRLTAMLWLLIAFAVTFDVAFLWQRASGAYTSEFGAHPDEAAHYVTGLFVRDAVTTVPSCLSQKSIAPMKAFGPDAPGGFYSHYPKVALGVWPPAFYVVQSAWTLPFGVSRTSVMLLIAALAGAVGVLIFRVVRAEFGTFAAVVAAFLWLSAPLVRLHYSMVMAETLSTLTMFSATLFWGRYLDESRKRDAVIFALFAAFAILTKGTGIALALMVLFSTGITRKWSVFRQRSTWLAATLVAIIAGPWTWYFRKAGAQVGGWADNSGGLSLAFTMKAIPFYGRHIVLATGIAVFAFAIIGALVRIRQRGPRAGRWGSIVALVLAVFVFQCIMPVGDEARHIISLTPALVVLAVAGMAWVAGLPRFRASESASQSRRVSMWVAVLALLSLPSFLFARVEKGCGGFAPFAEWLIAQAPKARVLICSDSEGEGMFISEVAMRDKRPGLTIERASKTLVDPKGRTWEGDGLKSRFDDEKLVEYLRAGKIDFILLDSAVPERRLSQYHEQFNRVIDQNMPAFWKVDEGPLLRDGEPVHRPLRLFRVKSATQLISK
jgi:hypothetical protein